MHRFINNLNTFLIYLVVASACLRDDDKPTDTMFDIAGSLDHDGNSRTYLIHLPSDYYTDTNTKMPLLLGFHGGFGSAENFRDQSGFNTKADQEGFIVVYPDGLQNPGLLKARTWNAGKCCGQNASSLNTDDVGFISKLINELVQKYRIDPTRVYATGHSNGAMFCYRLADELSQKIAAIAPNAGNFQLTNAYDPPRNIPVINIISKLDENVLYEGGFGNGPGGQYNPPTDSCLNVIASRAGCAKNKELLEAHPLYSIYRWQDCTPDSFEVLLYLTEDGGHSWPGGEKGHADADEPSQAFENNDVIWEFLKRYSL